MARTEEKFYKLKYPGAVDADGHIMEAADLWDKYAEARYKPRAMTWKSRDDPRRSRGAAFSAIP
jgi:hypothetical protein